MLSAWENLVAKVGRQLEVVYLAFTSKKVNVFTKILVCIIFLYAASPIDIIPDSIPFFGNVDDVLLVPVAYGLAKLTIKKDVWAELKQESDEKTIIIDKKYRIIGGCVVGALTIALLCWILNLIVR